MLVVQYKNMGQPEKGIKMNYLAQDKQREGFSLANFKNQAIYVVGGRMNNEYSDSVVVFNLETHEFKESAKLNTAR